MRFNRKRSDHLTMVSDGGLSAAAVVAEPQEGAGEASVSQHQVQQGAAQSKNPDERGGTAPPERCHRRRLRLSIT